MANHVENSLSDILNDPSFKLGELRKSGDLPEPDVDQLRAQVRILEARLLDKDRAGGATATSIIKAQISTLNAQIQAKLSATSSNATPRTKSMFDDKALIDYAKYVTSNPWEDNLRKRDSAGDLVKPYEFIRNNIQGMNRVVPGDNSLKNSEYNDGLSILNIIRWSEDYPALQLRYQDFTYCKHINVYPNNRLIILRKFRNGVPDNLFDYFHNAEFSDYAQPLATLVTWAKPTESLISMSFNEVWESAEGSFFTTPPAKQESGDSFVNMSLYNLNDNALFFSLMDFLDDNASTSKRNQDALSSTDSVSYAQNEPGGNPNLIRKAAKRLTGGKGLTSSIRFNLAFEFEWRMIDNIDPTIAMLDLLGNCMHMGSSVAQFRMDFNLLKSNTIQRILNGQFEADFESFFSQFKGVAETIFDTITDSVKNLVKTVTDIASGGVTRVMDEAGDVVTKTAKHIISAYRESMKNALYSETGLPGGTFHVTYGNPKNPIISCGDLVVDDSNIELGAELGLQDFPTSFKYNIVLRSARERGRNELERVFNAGRGRVYVYPSAKDNADYHLY